MSPANHNKVHHTDFDYHWKRRMHQLWIAGKRSGTVFLKNAYLNFIVCGLPFYMVNAL
jgi:hypothetical protein